MKHRRGIVIVLAVLVVAGLVASTVLPALLSARSGGDDAPTYTLDPVPLAPVEGLTTAPELAEFYDQELVWDDCGEHECTTFEVPLDYAKPKGRRIEIAALRVAAVEPEDRIGSLVVNPGGPGASGIEFAVMSSAVLGEEVRRAYDVVGFDPRGVGQSTPIDCVDDDTLDAYLALDPLPDDEAEQREAERLSKTFARGCLDHDAQLVRHVSTEEAARDIDILRELLGEEQLSWYGASYGTHLGAQYADLFPERVGRMVLDGATDPTLDVRETSLAQAEGFETALRSYVGNCVDSGNCFLGDSVDEGVATIVDLIEGLDDEPIEVGERELTIGNAFYGLIAPLYNQGYWTYLNLALRSLQSGDGELMLALADAYAMRGPDGYLSNLMEAIGAINCLDDGSFVPFEEIEQEYAAFEEASPTFGRIFAAGLAGCEDWPARGDGPSEPLTAEGAAPLLVTGTTRDPATPLAWAESLADQLSSAVLIRRDGDGHTAYGKKNACVDGAIEGYLVEGVVPDGPVDC